MLSIQNVKNAEQARTYYAQQDYYVGRSNDAPMSWWGRGAGHVGLQNKPFDVEVFCQALAGRLPTGIELPKSFTGERRAGTDLTFSAPKSVSIEALVCGNEALQQAHESAVTEALEYLQERGVAVRESADGTARTVPTDNLLVARFQHHTSRALDPQLHTHCVAINATRRDDGQWRAMVNTDLYRHKMAAGFVYRAELARRAQQLGYGIAITGEKGEWELQGYSREQLGGFSKRRQAIAAALGGELGAALRQMGVFGARAAKAATLATRGAKESLAPQALQALWGREAKELDISSRTARQSSVQATTGPRWLAPVVRYGENMAGVAPQLPVLPRTAVNWACEHLHARHAVLEERDVMHQALRAGMGSVTSCEVRAAVATQLQEGRVLKVGQRRVGQDRYATEAMLGLERELVQKMREGQHKYNRIMAGWMVEGSLPAKLNAGQRGAVVALMESRDFVVGMQGYAGTGKTSTLREVRKLAERSGYVVKGMSVSSQAARELDSGAGIRSTTVQKHLCEVRGGKDTGGLAAALGRKELWIVDEASFLGTHQAHAILSAARASGARVFLVGDRDQLPSVDAGRPFAELCDRGMQVTTLDEIVRQKEPRLLRAVHRAIARDHAGSLAQVSASVEEVEARDERLAAVAKRYLAGGPNSTLVVTSSNEERKELNTLIRDGLIARGDVEKSGVATQVLVRRDTTAVERRRWTLYDAGDVVRFGRAYNGLGVERGDYWRVTGRDDRGGILLTKGDREVRWEPRRAAKVELYGAEERELSVGDRIRWTRNDSFNRRNNGATAEVIAVDANEQTAKVKRPNGDLESVNLKDHRHWEYAYASTVHAAQGATFDRVIAHVNTKLLALVGHQSWYVALSRAVFGAEVLTDDLEALPDAIRRDQGKESALHAFERHGVAVAQSAAASDVVQRTEAVSSKQSPSSVSPSTTPSKHKPRVDYGALKKSVDLVQYALAHGYELDKRRSSRRSATLRQGKEKLVVKRGNDGTWLYFSVHNPTDKGTVVDFAKNRLGVEASTAAQKLATWAQEHGDGKGRHDILLVPSANQRERSLARLRHMEPARATLYLDLRGITTDVLTHDRFTGCVLRDDERNAIFLHHDADGLCGYETKGPQGARFAAGTARGLWHSNKTGDDTRLVIAEAPIDAMSYHALHGGEQTRYVATGGAIGDKQRELVKREVAAMPTGATVVLAFDNDEAGERFAADIGGLARPGDRVERARPSRGKDWNDMLLYRMGRLDDVELEQKRDQTSWPNGGGGGSSQGLEPTALGVSRAHSRVLQTQ